MPTCPGPYLLTAFAEEIVTSLNSEIVDYAVENMTDTLRSCRTSHRSSHCKSERLIGLKVTFAPNNPCREPKKANE